MDEYDRWKYLYIVQQCVCKATSLMYLRGVSFERYQQIFSSFNQSQSFELILNRHITVKQGNDEMLQKEYYKKLLINKLDKSIIILHHRDDDDDDNIAHSSM